METLPEGFLTQAPTQPITKQTIDFKKEGLPEYDGAYAVILDNVLSPEECKQLLHAAESFGKGNWERAMVNTGGGRQVMFEMVRRCGRVIWDSHEMVDRIWRRVEPHVPELARLDDPSPIVGLNLSKDIWRLTRLNERMRFLKYEGGEYFKPHCDGVYRTPDNKEKTLMTLHLYLNSTGEGTEDDPENKLIGGSTPFFSFNEDKRIDVEPKAGRILLFQHRDLIHSGDDVVSGVKYTMRTDVFFTKETKTVRKEDRSQEDGMLPEILGVEVGAKKPTRRFKEIISSIRS